MPESKKHCHVCGQPAAGYNFHGLSCQSCKIFFRRYANTPQKFTCSAANTCSVVGPYQRSCCQSCRLAKCFAVGMKKELINAKYTKRKKPTLIFVKKEKKEDENCTTAKLPSKSCPVSEKSFVDLHFDFHHLTSLLLPYEAVLFSELQQAMSSNFVNERLLPLSTSFSSNSSNSTTEPSSSSTSAELLAVYNTHCCYIRRVIGFCKAISVFRRLPLVDQLALLKEFYVDVLTLRAAVNYCPSEDSFPYMENDTGRSVLSMKLTLFQQAKVGGHEAEEGYRKFFLSMQELLQNDETLRDLLITYRLFEHRAGLTCPELICYQKAVYGHLLLRYLHHCKHPKSWRAAKKKYHALLDKLTELKVLNSLSYQIILSFNREQLGQVVAEVFDI